MAEDNNTARRDVAVHEAAPPPAVLDELSVDQVMGQIRKIQMLMKEGMKQGEHYGVIPGTPKPTLLKPGAEKLCLMFRLDPEYEFQKEMDGEHREITATCTLFHKGPTPIRAGSGLGSCSTRESKYAYRKSERACPKCGKETIKKSKFSDGKAWYCYAKIGGCGAQFDAGDPAIEKQETGRVANPDLADQYNTVLKMACKRSLVAAVLNVTAASDIFTQDLEDTPNAERVEPEDHLEVKLDDKQAPGDKASPAQVKNAWDMTIKGLGKEDGGRFWKAKLKEFGVKTDSLTVAHVTTIVKEVAEQRAAQEQADQANIDSFEAEQQGE